MSNRNYLWALAIALMAISPFTVNANDEDVVKEIRALQAEFIAAINSRDYPKVVASFHESYRGLNITEKGFMSLSMRKDMFKQGFASENRATVTILETDVRPLGQDYALLRSHIKVEYTQEKEPKEWWYTALYFRAEGNWQVIHEQ